MNVRIIIKNMQLLVSLFLLFDILDPCSYDVNRIVKEGTLIDVAARRTNRVRFVKEY